MKKLIYFVVLLMCPFCSRVSADSVATPASSVALALAGALKSYQDDHGGRLPHSWQELDGKYLSIGKLERRFGESVDAAFPMFPDASIEMIAPSVNAVFNGGKIIAVIAKPIGEDRRKNMGRYVIWKDKSGYIRRSWLDEQVVSQQFNKAGIELPTGPMQDQPPTRDASLDQVVLKYAEENFKDPKHPTVQEIEIMKQVFAERYSDKPPTTPSPTAVQTTSMLPPSTPRSAATVAAKESPSSFPIVPVAIIAAVVVVGMIVFLLRRKSP